MNYLEFVCRMLNALILEDREAAFLALTNAMEVVEHMYGEDACIAAFEKYVTAEAVDEIEYMHLVNQAEAFNS